MIFLLKKYKTTIALVYIDLFLRNSPGLAATVAAPDDTIQPLELPSTAGYFLQIIVTMIFIVFVTYLVMKLLKRQINLQQRQKNWIRIYDYQGLGNNRGIYLAEILGQIYVMAICDGKFSILQEIDPEDENWLAIKDGLEEGQEEILPPGLKKWLTGNVGLLRSRKTAAEKNFEKELDEQLARSQRLFRHISKGGKGDE